jgi:DNA repair exonuclease SbcCD ATPase subunit
LAKLKEHAYNTVSDKLKIFEENFSADLFRRREEFDTRLSKWKDTLDTELAGLAEESREERRKLENTFSDALKRHFADEDARLVSELEHLKAETGAFEEGIRNQIAQADESLSVLKDQLDRNLADARDIAEASVKAELGRFSISMAETLKQQQREIDGDLRKISSLVESRIGEFGERLDESRRHIEEWQNRFNGQMRDLDSSVDEYRRKIRDLGTENEERLTAVRFAIENLREETAAQRTEAFAHTDEQVRMLDSAIKDADRHIKEFLAQTKLFDQAEELKSALERKIEDLRGDLNGLDQRRTEAAELEAKFVKIKRLEEEVDAKMVAFQSEKRRIELMETDFNRLLQTSQSVKEKLIDVSTSDDTLQAVQVQIRRLEDSLNDVEERYQRIEKKNQILEETNAGIDDNFKALQEAERAVQKIHNEVQRLLDEQEEVRTSIEKLSAENVKARETAEKAASLDSLLSSVEQRMNKLQTARESLAKAETRFEEISKNVQEQFKLFSALLKDDEPGKGGLKERGAPPIGTRETVIKLKQQGWAAEEIARTVKLSVGEVELILEMGSKI